MGGRKEVFEVLQLIHSRQISPLVTEICLEDIPRYMQLLKDGEICGKLTVRPSHRRG